MELSGKHILVTGASQGIGRAIAWELMAQGGRVVVHYNTNENAARELIAEFPNTHSEMVQADLGKPEASLIYLIKASISSDISTP